MRTFAWVSQRAMEDDVHLSLARPARQNCVGDPERLYHERDIKQLIDAVKVLIDKTSGICEFSYSDEMEIAYARVRTLTGHYGVKYAIMRASNELRKDIDAEVMKKLK